MSKNTETEDSMGPLDVDIAPVKNDANITETPAFDNALKVACYVLCDVLPNAEKKLGTDECSVSCIDNSLITFLVFHEDGAMSDAEMSNEIKAMLASDKVNFDLNNFDLKFEFQRRGPLLVTPLRKIESKLEMIDQTFTSNGRETC